MKVVELDPLSIIISTSMDTPKRTIRTKSVYTALLPAPNAWLLIRGPGIRGVPYGTFRTASRTQQADGLPHQTYKIPQSEELLVPNALKLFPAPRSTRAHAATSQSRMETYRS